MIMIFATLNYISKTGVENQGEQIIKVSQLQQEAVAPVKAFVTSCFEDAVIQGLILIGKQGGYLYESQGGPAPDFNEQTAALGGDLGINFARFEDHNVGYAIFEPKGQVGTLLFSTTPKYPFVTFPELHSTNLAMYPTGVKKLDHFTGYYGINKIVPLNATQTMSAESQLKTFTANQLEDCLDWTLFPNNLEILTGQPEVEFTLAESDVVAKLYYEVNVTDKVSNSKAQLDEFLIKAPVRLKNLFRFMNDATDKDVTNISFSLVKAEFDGMKVQIVSDVFEDDYIVRLVDEESRIADEPYVFQFMAHNRAPALFLVNNTKNSPIYGTTHADDVNNFVVCASWTQNLDPVPAVLKIENGRFIINNAPNCDDPKVLDIKLDSIDPDDDSLEYVFNVADESGIFRSTQGVRKEITDELIQRLERGATGGAIFTDPLLVNITVRDEKHTDYQILAFQVARKAPS